MARKKRRPPQSPPPPPRDERLQTPFDELKALRRNVGSTPRPASAPAPRPPAPAPAPEPPVHVLSEVQMRRERALFLAEMAEVTPLPPDRRGRVGKRQQPSQRTQGFSGEAEALADLQHLVDGHGAFAIQYTDEYMEGVAPAVDRHLAHRLHRGDFAVQAHLDLHGYTVEEAKGLVDRFLTEAYTSGRRCVRLVHGRGRNSPDNRPVLKEQVQLWLSHGRLSRLVLAFATAPAADGGAGAVYVLLRRGPHAVRRK